MDSRGRIQYRYHQQWREQRDARKFGHMLRFAGVLPVLRGATVEDLARGGLDRDREAGVFAGLGLQLQCPLNVRPAPGRVADELFGAAPAVQGGGLTERVMRDAGGPDALVEQSEGRSAVSLVGREPRRAIQRVHPLRIFGWDPVEQIAQPPPAFGEVPAHRPEPGEPIGQAQPHGRIRLVVPVQRRPEIVVLELEQVEAGPARGGRRASEILGQVPEHRRVGVSHLLLLR